MSLIFPLIKGFGASAGLIIAIGAQSAFVLKQGLRKQHILLTALLCSLIDTILILFGVAGFGHILSIHPLFIDLTTYCASAFLFIYGAFSFRSAWISKKLDPLSTEETPPTITKTVLILLALSLLNPHVYLDTVILLGSIASQHPPDEKLFFTLGAIAASLSWFFTLSYGAQLLSPLLKKERSWRVIDFLVGCILWGIASTLLYGIFVS